MTKALIFDLDNTIYPVDSIADELFEGLFTAVEEYRELLGDAQLQRVKEEFKRRPYQEIAAKYNFSDELNRKGLECLQNITYNKPITAYPGYHEVILLPLKKFLVTKGFTKLQNSKVAMLGIAGDFDEIHIVDPAISILSKRDVFEDILKRYNYMPTEMLVIGDDPASEIKAAQDLGIPTFLYDPAGTHLDVEVNYRSGELPDVANCLSN